MALHKHVVFCKRRVLFPQERVEDEFAAALQPI